MDFQFLKLLSSVLMVRTVFRKQELEIVKNNMAFTITSVGIYRGIYSRISLVSSSRIQYYSKATDPKVIIRNQFLFRSAV